MDRGRRRRPRDRTRLPGGGRPGRPRRRAGLHGLPRPLPHLGPGTGRGEAGRLRVARRGTRAPSLGTAPRARALAARLRHADERGVTSVHDKDGWRGALRLWGRLEERGSLTLRVWQSIPYEKLDDAVSIGIRSGLGGPYLRLGYLKVFMGGTLGSRT